MIPVLALLWPFTSDTLDHLSDDKLHTLIEVCDSLTEIGRELTLIFGGWGSPTHVAVPIDEYRATFGEPS